jgi:hypothetical protein
MRATLQFLTLVSVSGLAFAQTVATPAPAPAPTVQTPAPAAARASTRTRPLPAVSAARPAGAMNARQLSERGLVSGGVDTGGGDIVTTPAGNYVLDLVERDEVEFFSPNWTNLFYDSSRECHKPEYPTEHQFAFNPSYDLHMVLTTSSTQIYRQVYLDTAGTYRQDSLICRTNDGRDADILAQKRMFRSALKVCAYGAEYPRTEVTAYGSEFGPSQFDTETLRAWQRDKKGLRWAKTSTPLENVPDEGNIRLLNAARQQLAIQVDDLVVINAPLFESLDNENKGILYIHEVVLCAAKMLKARSLETQGTEAVRALVRGMLRRVKFVSGSITENISNAGLEQLYSNLGIPAGVSYQEVARQGRTVYQVGGVVGSKPFIKILTPWENGSIHEYYYFFQDKKIMDAMEMAQERLRLADPIRGMLPTFSADEQFKHYVPEASRILRYLANERNQQNLLAAFNRIMR